MKSESEANGPRERILRNLARLASLALIALGLAAGWWLHFESGLTQEPETLRERLGVPFEGIAYQPINVFQYRFAERFWFGHIEGAESARMFIHTAESPAAAKDLFDKLHGELLEDYDGIESAPRSALLQHKFLETYFGLMQSGDMVFGVERHPEREGVQVALERMGDALVGGDEQAGEEGYHGEDEGGEY